VLCSANVVKSKTCTHVELQRQLRVRSKAYTFEAEDLRVDFVVEVADITRASSALAPRRAILP
jgi:hypothetical protein